MKKTFLKHSRRWGMVFVLAFATTLSINSKTGGGLSLGGKPIGKVTRTKGDGQAAFQANVRKVTAGIFQDLTGRKLGRIAANGDVLNSSERRIAHIASNGVITDINTGTRIGMIDGKGFVEDKTGKRIGQLHPNGDVSNSTGSRIGHIYPNGDFDDRTSSKVARFTGAGRYVAAVCYYFFFDFK